FRHPILSKATERRARGARAARLALLLRALCVLCALCVPLLPASAQTAAPQLPHLALDAFPPATRAAIAEPYQKATARPDEADAAGALARTLHAWEQWSAAHEAYARAEALAPKIVEWPYLDGVVLQRLARHEEAVARFERALQLSPQYQPARVKLAEAHFE